MRDRHAWHMEMGDLTKRVRALLPALLALVVVAVWMAVLPSSASASFGIASFDGGAFDGSGNAYTQAGGHPYELTTSFTLNQVTDPSGAPLPEGGLKTANIDLPPGVVGNPTAMPTCESIERVTEQADPAKACSLNSIIGLATVQVIANGTEKETRLAPIFNMDPPPGVAAQFAFNVLGFPAIIDAVLSNDGEYRIRARTRFVTQAATVLGSQVTIWGVPAAPEHDSQRCLIYPLSLEQFPLPMCIGPAGTPVGPNPASVPARAFVTNPTRCTGPGEGLVTSMQADAWIGGGSAEASFVSHSPPGAMLPPGQLLPPDQWGPVVGLTGCDKLPFQPRMDVSIDSPVPDTPSGVAVDLSFPQDLTDPARVATAHLKDASVTFPEGMTISPSAAHGLTACTDAQAALTSNQAAQCPEASQIGTVEAETPVLKEQLTGSVYTAAQQSQDPESGEMFRVFLVLGNEARGIHVKLKGSVRADARTGRLVASFANNPQMPVSRIRVALRSGPNAPLATPPTCGVHEVTAHLTSWAGQVANLSDQVSIACPGVHGFTPSFDAGVINPVGGAFSALGVRINRANGQEYLDGVTLDMPTGLLAKLKGVPLCAEASAAAGSCPVESRIGTATVAAGPGAEPFYLKGTVSLTEGYKGAPYGLSVAVPAVAGPFDLGMVVVRQAIFVDPHDASLSVVSDPLPIIVRGVPVRLRSVNVDVDRPGFTINPTSCAEKAIRATLHSQQSSQIGVAARFQVAGCRALPLKPRLRMRLTGRKRLSDGRHPGLRAVLTQRAGQVNLKGVKVKLPLSLALDPKNAASDSLCSFEESRKPEPKCPASSIVGTARAVTPLLNRPLTGPVYFAKNVRTNRRGRQIRTFPALVIPLRGEVALNLIAESNVRRRKLVTTFATVPDAPVSRFALRLKGGKKGILVVNGRVCKRSRTALVDFEGHSGRQMTRSVRLRAPCRDRKARRGSSKRDR